MGRSEQLTERITKSFGKHVARYWRLQTGNSPVVELLRFQEPGANNYFIEFILTNGTLMVRGDLGEAAYCWYGDIDFNFLAGIDMGYMASKCQASEVGGRFVDWDEGEGRVSLKGYMECQDDDDELDPFMADNSFKLDENDEYSDDQYKEARKLLTEKRCKDILYECEIGNEFEWAANINRLDDPGETFNDHDYWEWAYNVGKVPHVRLFCHYIGLKLAVKQLQTKEMMDTLKAMNRC